MLHGDANVLLLVAQTANHAAEEEAHLHGSTLDQEEICGNANGSSASQGSRGVHGNARQRQGPGAEQTAVQGGEEMEAHDSAEGKEGEQQEGMLESEWLLSEEGWRGAKILGMVFKRPSSPISTKQTVSAPLYRDQWLSSERQGMPSLIPWCTWRRTCMFGWVVCVL